MIDHEGFQPQPHEGGGGNEDDEPSAPFQGKVFPVPSENETDGKDPDHKRNEEAGKPKPLEKEAGKIPAHNPHPIVNALCS